MGGGVVCEFGVLLQKRRGILFCCGLPSQGSLDGGFEMGGGFSDMGLSQQGNILEVVLSDPPEKKEPLRSSSAVVHRRCHILRCVFGQATFLSQNPLFFQEVTPNRVELR